MPNHPFFATAALGLEPLLADELLGLGAKRVKAERAGVSFAGDLRIAYRACLWSRLASRVLLPLAHFPATDTDQLYREVKRVRWSEHLGVSGTLAVDCNIVGSRINHSHFAALRVKDAIVDQFQSRYGERPSVSIERPDLRINLHLFKDQATLSIDLAGDSLHRRGYRLEGVEAPMKENLAAAILIRGGWPDIAAVGGALVDPMCGSGTLPIEAALMATDTAPGLLRYYFGFLGWRHHAEDLWQGMVEEARERRRAGVARWRGSIVGFDSDGRAVKAAWRHATNAGLDKLIHFERRTLEEFKVPTSRAAGLLVANPPYGERLGEQSELAPLYNLLGEKMATHCRGWKAAVITSEKELGRAIGLRAAKINALYNGALKCVLLQFDLDEKNQWLPLRGRGESDRAPAERELSAGANVPHRCIHTSLKVPAASHDPGFQADSSSSAIGYASACRTAANPPGEPSPGSRDGIFMQPWGVLAEHLKKRFKKYAPWAREQGIDCYRLYDADLPEYAVAIDLYGDEVSLQVYRTPKEVDPVLAEQRLQDVLDALPRALGILPGKIHLKVREQQKGLQQYEVQSRRGVFKEVREGNCTFLVNLSDYIDTGLFLDHRPTRQLIQKMANGKRFLNLFAYTGAATVHALVGGAVKTTTVDMSRTYLDWARRNIALNGYDPAKEELVSADCLSWIDAMQAERPEAYDLIFLDPPTFSNSKSMKGTFDVQRDHIGLLRQVIRLLSPEGQLIFSTNLRSFKLKASALPELQIEDLGGQTIPFDYEGNPRIHHCWMIRHMDW